ncbi:GNAT family N-acetyltransferase [Pseudomonas vancouverensis]|uniref:GNAT family N-acetyltransferase n=1 Tax=Pseudomonas vancouverensis TaxID=95300 RepID=A0A1H2NXY9_PSEVA|nr:GNAT family N-acetyltransferase [Pseudomonas vancouverensis]KAB0496490.1 GNAT family N-acetyltransferase [Pseudomonas vancouverensis]TDB64802.1 GNAT family N-acetyltransferase [Pseudomonas vancouverensis]SDV09971.1 Ribosomal protein S18 acetylase RimI [Pseudomonas vancouverensis]
MELIRHATSIDAPTIVQFIMEEAREAEALALDQSIVEKGVKSTLVGAVPRYWVVVNQADESIIASASIYTEWSDWNNANYWWLQSFYLVPSARGQGLAQRLLQQIANEAIEAGAIELRLYVHKDNQRASASYVKAGFDTAPYDILIRKLPQKIE